MNPFSKIVGLVATILTFVQGLTHEQIVGFLTPIVGSTVAGIIAIVVLAISGIIVALSHSQTGTGGTAAINDPRADRGLGVNMLSNG